MEKIQKWSLGLLFLEEKATSEEISFRYPSRLQAAVRTLVVLVLTAGLVAWARQAPSNEGPGIFLWILGALAVLMNASVAFRRIWEQRVLLLRSEERTLTLLIRTPLRSRRLLLPFPEMKTLIVEEQRDRSLRHFERHYSVFLMTRDGSRIFLGASVLKGALDFAARLSGLIGIPLEQAGIRNRVS